MRTVELLADEGLDRAVRAAWRRLDQAGFSSLGQHRHPTNRPHLTLATADCFPAGAAVQITVALRALPVQIQLSGPEFLGGRTGFVAWTVDGGPALRDLQAQIWSALDGADRNPRHEPGIWTPHVSLARGATREQMTPAAEAAGLPPLGGTLNSARSYESVTRTVTPLP